MTVVAGTVTENGTIATVWTSSENLTLDFDLLYEYYEVAPEALVDDVGYTIDIMSEVCEQIEAHPKYEDELMESIERLDLNEES